MYRSAIIALIVSICHISVILSVVRTRTTNRTLISEKFFYDDDQIVGSAQVLGACTNEPSRDIPPCPFFLETRRSVVDSSDHTIACKFDVAFPKDSSGDNDDTHNKLVTIAKDKALLILTHGCIHNLYVLHFSNCRAVPVMYNNDTSIRACTWHFYVQAPRDDLFDVLLDGPTYNKLRRLTVNVDGKVVADLPEWVSSMQMIAKSILYSPTKGRLVGFFKDEIRDEKKWTLKILAIDDNGRNHTIREYNVSSKELIAVGKDGKFYPSDMTVPNTGEIRISVTNDLLSACLPIYWNTLNCIQYDANGYLKFDIQFYSSIQAREIYNLAGGGFVLLFDMCLERKFLPRLCPQEKREHSVSKVDRRGQVVGSLKIPTFNNCDGYQVQITFFEAENGEHCFSMICARKDLSKERTHVFREITCYDEGDYVRYPIVFCESVIK